MSDLHQLGLNDFRSIMMFTTGLARRAGALILEGSAAIQSASYESGVGEKKNSVDLVTEYDVKVEKLVQDELKAQFPTFSFIGEESYSAGARPPLTDAPTFCVDPIDGTTNFIHGFPFVCISIGLIYKKRPVLGVIYNPFLDHLYTGIRGQGSFLMRGAGTPQLRLPLSAAKPLPSLSQALIAIEWGSDRSLGTISAKSDSFSRLTGNPAQGVIGGKMAHSLRSVGSAALNYALVAQGGLDLYWEIGCWPWDVCAGIVIAEEAGGVVTGSHSIFATTENNGFGEITEEILIGRKYLVVRGIADTPGEKGVDAQKRIIKEFYASVDDVEPN
ncbi:inositol monophosphatase [Pholiota conissans]|uniref:Inositol-1-monophosphatase n=1 Tax=Pholiota conissans TaxID=109636 RepID=A0A9P6CZL2_9AGAR|nr:inositol monophosphatase [Pholiota conissans]